MAIGSVYNAYPNGRPSGLPVDIVEQLVQDREQQKLDPINQDIEEAQNQKDTYTSLNSNLRTLYQSADALSSSDSFQSSSAQSSDSEVAEATASSGAVSGTYSLNVSKLAKAHNLILGLQDSQEGVNQGLSNINDPNQINDDVTLSFYHNGKEYSYTTDASTTLSSLAEQINDQDNGVTAQTYNRGSAENPEYVLNLKSQSSGQGQNIISTDPEGENPGLSIDTSESIRSSLFRNSQGEDTQAEFESTQAGQDAEFSLDGVSLTSSSNEVEDAIPGVTLELTGSGEAQINVGLDTETITENVQSFVENFNSFDSFLDENASYDPQTEEAGPLLGDSITRNAKNNLRSIVSNPVAGTEENSYQNLSQIGIEFQRDGTLDFDSSKFAQALENDPQAVEALFVGENGVAGQMASQLQSYTSAGSGIIPNKISSIQEQIQDLNQDYAEAEEDLLDYEEMLTQKYTNLEEAVMKYQSVEEQLTNIVDSWDLGSG